MRCRLAEARVSWGKGETDGALRAARAVATRLRGRVEGGGGGRDTAAPVVVVAVDGREREEQRILSEVSVGVVWGHGEMGRAWTGGREGALTLLQK